MSLYSELKRRNVFRVAIAYLAGAWLLTEVAETLFPLFGFSEAPVRMVVTVLAIGFPLFLIFSWVFEITPQGLRREVEVSREDSITRFTGKKIDRVIIVLLAVTLGYFAFDKFVLSSRWEASLEAQKVAEVAEARKAGRTEALVESYGDKSIAVLPFVNMSSDVEQEYFSDGISEEMLNLLAKVPELRVTSRSSAFAFKGEKIDVPVVAEKLNVAHILEGSVRKSGNQVRITVQLIEARSDTHLWSETFDRTLDDIFAIQDEIAAKVVEQLKITLLGDVPTADEINPEAYALYLQARHLARLNSAEGFTQSNELLERALAIEPGYAAAWSGLATNYMNQTMNGLLPDDDGFTQARQAAEKALTIDPEHAEALATLGWVTYVYNNDVARAAPYYEQALKLDPANSYILRRATTLLQSLDRREEAIELQKYANARDPVAARGHANLAYYYLHDSRWDESIASYQTALRLSPDYIGAHYFTGVALLYKQQKQAALDAFALEPDEEYQAKGTALALYDLGRQEEFQAKLDELIERWGDQWPSEVAHVYAYTGDADAAFLWLEKAIEVNEDGLSEQFLLPFYQNIHADPRWDEFLHRVGSSPEQLNAVEFEFTLH
jgi:TolB-like protein/Tfp pilus assembly protein PilF